MNLYSRDWILHFNNNHYKCIQNIQETKQTRHHQCDHKFTNRKT